MVEDSKEAKKDKIFILNNFAIVNNDLLKCPAAFPVSLSFSLC